MKILITGGSGFLGSALRQALPQHQWAVFSRQARPEAGWFNQLQQAVSWQPELIINLAGESLFSHRWTAKRWQAIEESRIGLTQELFRLCQQQPPKRLISGSAIGFYGEGGEQLLTEHSAAGSDQSSLLCQQWEQAALQFRQLGTEVCCVRTGLVMSAKGGALQPLLPLFKLGMGGPLGLGKHYWSWISLADWLAAMRFLIEQPELKPAYNFTAPEPLQQKEFARILGQALKRPSFLPTPSPALYLSMGADRAKLLLCSQRVLPQALLEQGFRFQHPSWQLGVYSALARE